MALVFCNVTVLRNQEPLFEPVSLTLKTGLHAIVGSSGSGKSSLLLAVVGLLEPLGCLSLEGYVTLDNQQCRIINQRLLRKQVTLVTQHPVMFFGSIVDNICIGALHQGQIQKSQKKEFALGLLRKVGLYSSLKNRLDDDASVLSLGQKQRVSLARSLAIEPRYLLLDEPTSSLDSESVKAIEELLIELKSEIGIVLVSHNTKQVEKLADSCSDITPIYQSERSQFQKPNSGFKEYYKKYLTLRTKTIAKEI